MKKPSILLFCLLSLLVLVAVAMAAEPVAISPAPAALEAFLRETVYPLLTAALLALLAIPLRWLGNRFKIDYLMQRNNAIEQLAFQGISLAQEVAAKCIGAMPQLTGVEKLDIAVSHVLAAMPTVSKDQAERIVEALLAQIPGVGATKEQTLSRDGFVGLSAPLQSINVTTTSESGFIRLPLLASMALIGGLLLCLAGCATTSPTTPTQSDSPQVLAGKSLLAVKSIIVTAATTADRMCTTGAMAADKCSMARTAYGQSKLAYDSAVDAYLLMIQGSDPAAFTASLQRVQSLAANMLQLAGGAK